MSKSWVRKDQRKWVDDDGKILILIYLQKIILGGDFKLQVQVIIRNSFQGAVSELRAKTDI